MIFKLRALMKEKGVDAVIIPTEDTHLDEYIPECFKLREYLSGFTGSSGTIVVTMEKCILWTDGRYYLQAERELKGKDIVLFKASEKETPKTYEFLIKELKKGSLVGVDGSLFSKKQLDIIITELEKEKINIDTDFNSFAVWEKRPSFPSEKLFLLHEQYCGESLCEKVKRVRQKMKTEGFTHYLTAMPECAMWLLNLRGNDIMHTPVALCYLLLTMTEIRLYIDENKTNDVKQYLAENNVTVSDYNSIYKDLSLLSDKDYLAVDFNRTNYKLIKSVACMHKDRKDFVIYLKCIKSDTEIENIKKAYLKENVALTKSFYSIFHTGGLSEYDVVNLIEENRKKQVGYFSMSFDTIAAFGKNAAIVHYTPTAVTNSKIENNGLLLIDTGGQYYEGTTDTTRTLVLGHITDDEGESLTRVLKGNIALLTSVFPKDKTGSELDAFTRRPLWQKGLDYNHAAGHGIGYFLGVHEGPQRISPSSTEVLKPNMTLSDEPGVYIKDSYGIRIENHLCVREYNEDFLCFEILNYCPIGTRGLKKEILEQEEIEWLNAYNEKCIEMLAVYLTKEENEWLKIYAARI